jgi:uncharacterized membrane protein
MDEPADEDLDPLAEEPRTIGSGLFERDMGPSSSMAHLYRGELHRMTRWRERLDRTTNWAVTVMAAILTWAFSDLSNPHYMVLVGAVAVTFFLGLEAHRFRGYIVWRTRVRLIQENVWAHGLDPTEEPLHADWRKELAADYREPTLKIGFEEALAHRLRRIYLPMLLIILTAWALRTTVVSQSPWPESASIGAVPGAVVSAIVVAFAVGAAVVAFRPREWKGHPELRSQDIGRWQEE